MAGQKTVQELKVDNLSMRQLMELDACTRCGECLKWCPVYEVKKDERINARGKLLQTKKILRNQYSPLAKIFGHKVDDETMKGITADINECAGCAACHVSCPVRIDTERLWISLKESLIKSGYGPLDSQLMMIKGVTDPEKVNPFGEPRAKRGAWLPKNYQTLKKSKYLYFVGCAGSYSANRIPRSVIRILDTVKDFDYTLLGGEEVCCGDPIARIGLIKEADELVAKNVEKFEELGVETIFAACSGCYKNLLHRFPKKYEILHVTELFEKLIGDGGLRFTKDLNRKAIFFDGCDSARVSGLYEPPRNILKAIPGFEVIDFDRNRAYAMCCGGPMSGSHPDMGYGIAAKRIEEARDKGVDLIITSCPTCMVTLREGAKNAKIEMEVQDLPMLLPGLLEGK